MHPLKAPSKPLIDHDSFVVAANVNSFWAEGPILYKHNSKTNMSSLRPPTLFFPEQLPIPTGLPLRIPPLTPKLAELDAIYNKNSHLLLAGQGSSCTSCNEKQDESRNKDALKILEAKIKARTPYIELASKRFQAAAGLRNDLPFDLPELPMRKLSPNMQALYNVSQEGFTASSLNKGGSRAMSAARGKKDGGIAFTPKSPVGIEAVDRETGKGLREFMLQKAKECGMRKRECKSIGFYDFTPDMRSGFHQNLSLGHYAAEEGERVDVYEVDLPATRKDGHPGEESPTTETWIWILISRPLVSFDESETSTYVPPAPPSLFPSASDISYATHSQSSTPEPPNSSPTPPNFPHPTPHSWLVFAAPKSHITTYPEIVEHPDGTLGPCPPPSAFAFTSAPPPQILKRIDYDFSFSGIPLFEFSSADLFTATSPGRRTEFLSIERMGAWCENDPYVALDADEYKRMFESWADGKWGLTSDELREGIKKFDEHGRPRAPCPVPNRGVWWKVFYERMEADVERWRRIRQAMGRGMCRVVVRWVEKDGVEVEKWVGPAGTLRGKKGAGAQGRRLTRSEARRRSALGERPLGLAIGGVVGLGEGSKTRAAGREVGRGGSESGKVRKH